MYIKISSKSSKSFSIDKIISLSLIDEQEIISIQVIDNHRILITVGNNHEIYGIIFDIDAQKIIQKIKK